MPSPVTLGRDLVGPYRHVLAVPGARAFVASGWLARLPMTAGLGTVLLVAGYSGSFALAGLCAAGVNVASAVAQPWWARRADRVGQRRVLRVVVPAQVLAGAVLVAVVLAGAPRWIWPIASVLVGAASMNVGALVRSRWSAVLDRSDDRQTAFALEGVLDEFVFVVGPPVITVAAALVDPAAGFAGGLLLGAVGALVLAGRTATEPPVTPATTAAAPRRARRRGWGAGLGAGRGAVVVVAGVTLGVGAVFGGFEVATVALAAEQDAAAFAGVAMAASSVGSLLAGLLYGVAPPARDLGRRYTGCVLVLACSTQLLLVADSLPLLSVVALLASAAIAPVLITGSSLIESRVPVSALNEALTWPGTALALGLTTGAAVAGAVVDAWGGAAGFLVPSAGALLAGVLAGAGWWVQSRA